MNVLSSSHIIGKLAGNPRGKRLQKYLAAKLAVEPPEGTGWCFASGQDYQTRTPAEQRKWLAWAAQPGNAILLVPPFQTSVRNEPNHWEVASLEGPPGLDDMAHRVLSLTQQEISASFTRGLAPTMNPLIEGGTRLQLSGLYRKHPAAGIFAATAVPIWSLALADHVPVLVDWLNEWARLVGRPEDVEPVKPSIFEPSQLHYSLMVYLASDNFPDRETAIQALEGNDTFDFRDDDIHSLLDEVTAAQWVSNATLTESGRRALMESPYRPYAEVYLKLPPPP